MRFGILGPIRVQVGHSEIAISARRERILLAALLLHVDQRVSLERIVDAMWAERPPKDAASQVHGSVYRLRKRLATAGLPDPIIVTEPAGYRARVDPQGVDLWEFRRLRDKARAAAAHGEPARARSEYRSALGLWRGPALDGIDSELIRHAAAALDEEHAQAWEECLEVELAIGGAGELVAELTELVQQHPYREGLHGKLMLALYRTGRQADALMAYRQARRQLRDELGTEPGEDLQQLHQAILNRDPDLTRRRTVSAETTWITSPIPRQLPHDAAGFTGRAEALQALDQLLPDTASDPPARTVITAIAGTAGVGKTALAVHWAHRAAGWFPDGQLYIDLRGYSTATPLRPIDALATLLRALGIEPDQVPTDEVQAAGLYRSQLAGQRLLVVLDNARSADQVRPLLPGTPGSLVLITSRDRLAGLVAREGAYRIILDPLKPDEARSLLTELLGRKRIQSEPDAAANLARACAHLPLALRLAAANLLNHPNETILDHLAELSDPLTSLQADSDGGSAVRATLDLSFRSIPIKAQRLFRLLGLIPSPDFSTAAVSALAGTTQDDAKGSLEQLTAAHLISEHARGRYTFHDLLRSYARDLANSGSADVRVAATRRWFNWYLQTADDAVNLLYREARVRLPIPPADPDGPRRTRFRERDRALAWLEVEQVNLVAAVLHAAENGPRAYAWLLADCLRGYHWSKRPGVEWQTFANAAVTASDAADDLSARAAARINLGDYYYATNRHTEAVDQYTSAVELARRADWTDGQAACHMCLGANAWTRGQNRQAAKHWSKALALYEQTGFLGGKAAALGNLGLVANCTGRLQQAAKYHRRSSDLFRELDSDRVAGGLHNLGVVHLWLGELDRAHKYTKDALALHRSVGDRYGEALALANMAEIHLDADRLTEALHLANKAAASAVAADLPEAEAVAYTVIGSAHLRLRRPRWARDSYQRSLDLARQASSRTQEIYALLGLAAAHCLLSRFQEAKDVAECARTHARENGYRIFEGMALTGLAEIHFSCGSPDTALEFAESALSNHRETGYRLGEARTLSVVERVLCATDRAKEASKHRDAAHRLFAQIGASAQFDTR